MKTSVLISGLVFGALPLVHGAALTQSTFTEIIHDVNVVSMPTKSAAPATLKELFKTPDIVRTGPDSRAELTAPDQTITRVGANTAFWFEPAKRDINLEQGSILFHSPAGKGGGVIKSGGASAAVLGTTLIVATTPVTSPTDKNGFKVIVLEGKGRVTLKNGRYRDLHAGQMVFVLAGQDDFGPVLDINLGKLVDGSRLVNGFSHPLDSLARIKDAIKRQDYDLAHGRAEDTGMAADNFPKHRTIPGSGASGNGTSAIDGNTFQLGVLFSPMQSAVNFRAQLLLPAANIQPPTPGDLGILLNSPLQPPP